jgi:hypothetical protein
MALRCLLLPSGIQAPCAWWILTTNSSSVSACPDFREPQAPVLHHFTYKPVDLTPNSLVTAILLCNKNEGVLDERGQVYIDELDPGNCQVQFPNIDAREWRTA